jgi:hypothetical protein
VLKKKIWANCQRIIELFAQKIVTKLSKVWVWDPGSEIRDPEKTYSGSRGQKGTGSRNPDPQQCLEEEKHWLDQSQTSNTPRWSNMIRFKK